MKPVKSLKFVAILATITSSQAALVVTDITGININGTAAGGGTIGYIENTGGDAVSVNGSPNTILNFGTNTISFNNAGFVDYLPGANITIVGLNSQGDNWTGIQSITGTTTPGAFVLTDANTLTFDLGTWDDTFTTLTLESIPEPSSAALALLSCAFPILRRKR
ncbi:MAG: hypothetical protein ACSHYF_16230 [Verrucomicrobiaceae bacterium]